MLRTRLRRFHYLLGLLGLLGLAAGPVAGQPRPGGSIGIVPGAAVPAAAGRPDVVVARSRGVAVAGVLPAGTGLLATYHARVPRGKAACVRVEPGVGVTWRGRPPVPGAPGQSFLVRWTLLFKNGVLDRYATYQE